MAMATYNNSWFVIFDNIYWFFSISYLTGNFPLSSTVATLCACDTYPFIVFVSVDACPNDNCIFPVVIASSKAVDIISSSSIFIIIFFSVDVDFSDVVFVSSVFVSSVFVSVTSDAVFSVEVLLSSVVLFSDFTYVLLISSNLFFPFLSNAISKYTVVPDVVVLYKTLDDFTELLSNKTSFVSLSKISNFPTVVKFETIVSVFVFSGICTIIWPFCSFRLILYSSTPNFFNLFSITFFAVL